jgi:hypothetical protein
LLQGGWRLILEGPPLPEPTMQPVPWRLELRDFRVFRRADFAPEGVVVLAAPNGAGKTTAHRALQLLSVLFNRNHEDALSIISPRLLRRAQATDPGHVLLSLSVGDVTWRLRLAVDSQGLTGRYGEELLREDVVVARAAMHQEDWHYLNRRRTMPMNELRCCARIVWDEERPAWLEPLFRLLNSLRVHLDYDLNRLRGPWQRGGRHTYLHPTGANLWTVLDNWRGSRRHAEQYNWTLEHAQRAFPDLISGIDFTPFLGVYRPDAPEEAIPPELLANGLLTGLCHLTAVAGAEDGATLTFDEVEDALHPHAIRTILAAMRQRADERGLTILLTTHSPVVLNEFSREPSQVFVIERARAADDADRSEVLPLTEARDRGWLSHFELGDLYAAEDIAPQSALAVAGA